MSHLRRDTHEKGQFRQLSMGKEIQKFTISKPMFIEQALNQASFQFSSPRQTKN